jgi:hypothetical protein
LKLHPDTAGKAGRLGLGGGAILLAYAALVCLRMPQIVLQGRFWAEEGPVFFRHAWDLPAWQALWTPFGGYLNIVANLATLVARWVLPLRLAPYATISTGLVFQLLPPLLLLTARDRWLRPWAVRLAGVTLLLLMPASEEIWLQTLHSQFELALCCGILVSLQARRGLSLGLLVLGPLAGPVSIALCPLFVLRAALERSIARALQCCAICAGALVQLVIFLTLVPGRAYALHPVVTLSVVTLRHLAIPLLGIHEAKDVNTALLATFAAGHVPWAATVLPVLILGAIGVGVIRQGLAQPGVWFFASFVLAAGFSYFGAFGGGLGLLAVQDGQHYSVAPQSLLVLAVLALAVTGGSWLARAAIAWLLVVGVMNYWIVAPPTRKGPHWRAEVAAWQADPSQVLRIWPHPWTMELKRKEY